MKQFFADLAPKWGFPAAVLALYIYKITFVERIFSGLTGCNNCFLYITAKHDALVVSLLMAIYWLSLYEMPAILRVLLRLSSLVVFGLYSLDLYIYKSFFTRLTVEDMFKFGSDGPGYVLTYVSRLLSTREQIAHLLISVLLVLFLYAYLRDSTARSRLYRSSVLILSLCMGVLFFLPDNLAYVHKWAYQNVFEYNLGRGVDREYSEAFKARLKRRVNDDSDAVRTFSKLPGKKNIIVVLIESLSMYHSKYFSGLSDNTPRIDSIARECVSSLNFYANGFTSEGALIAIFLGIPPIPAIHQYTNNGTFAFEGFYDSAHALPRKLRSAGYTTEFLTTAGLQFYGQLKWLENLGFESIEEHDHPSYAKWKRYVFDAAPDEALYQRAMERISRIPKAKPLFMVLETVSSHHPFINPENDQHSEQGAVAYADKQLGKFYERLKQRDFFTNGILIVLGDHRSMTPVKKAELDKYGEAATARVPFLVCMNTPPQVLEKPFQQVDIYSSLSNYVAAEGRMSSWLGDFLAEPAMPADCVLHARGDERDTVSVFCGNETARVLLKGDETAIVAGTVSQPSKILDKINFERIRRTPKK